MKLVFDARHIGQPFTGLGRYAASLLGALLDSADAPGLAVDVLLHRGPDWAGNFHFQALRRHIDAGRCQLRWVDVPPFTLRQHWALARAVNQGGGDLYFYPHFDPPLGVTLPTVFVVHDLIPLLVPGYVQRLAPAKRWYFRQMIRLAVRRAQRCIAVSETTRDDVLRLVGARLADKVSVAYEGPVLDRSAAAAATAVPVDGPYLLYVGDRRPHKNLRRVIDLHAALQHDHGYGGRLLLVGSRQNHGFDVDAYLAGRPGVAVLGNVSDAELLALYARCDALVFLSAYEGFGLPVVEAAQFDRRTILSDGGALPEIAPPSALVLPRDLPVDAAAARAADYLTRPQTIDHTQFNARFSWERAARSIFPSAYR